MSDIESSNPEYVDDDGEFSRHAADRELENHDNIIDGILNEAGSSKFVLAEEKVGLLVVPPQENVDNKKIWETLECMQKQLGELAKANQKVSLTRHRKRPTTSSSSEGTSSKKHLHNLTVRIISDSSETDPLQMGQMHQSSVASTTVVATGSRLNLQNIATEVAENVNIVTDVTQEVFDRHRNNAGDVVVGNVLQPNDDDVSLHPDEDLSGDEDADQIYAEANIINTTERVGPPVPVVWAEKINECWGSNKHFFVMKPLYEKYLIPENCQNVKVPTHGPKNVLLNK